MRNLSDAECGRLFRALLKYSAGDTLINLDGRESIAFDFITSNIDRDQKAYDKKCEKAKVSAESRYKKDDADANGCERIRTDANGCERCQEKEKEKEKGKEEYNTPSIPQGDEDNGFSEFWKVYPRKEAKEAAKKAWKKLNPSEELQKEIIAGVEYAKGTAQWQKDDKQFIPLPATYLNGKRWTDERTEHTDTLHALDFNMEDIFEKPKEGE